jgi:adenylosuccinate synthase
VAKEKIEGLPADLDLLEKVEVEYVVFKDWLKSIGQCRSFYDLPLAVSNSGGSLFPSY